MFVYNALPVSVGRFCVVTIALWIAVAARRISLCNQIISCSGIFAAVCVGNSFRTGTAGIVKYSTAGIDDISEHICRRLLCRSFFLCRSRRFCRSRCGFCCCCGSFCRSRCCGSCFRRCGGRFCGSRGSDHSCGCCDSAVLSKIRFTGMKMNAATAKQRKPLKVWAKIAITASTAETAKAIQRNVLFSIIASTSAVRAYAAVWQLCTAVSTHPSGRCICGRQSRMFLVHPEPECRRQDQGDTKPTGKGQKDNAGDYGSPKNFGAFLVSGVCPDQN